VVVDPVQVHLEVLAVFLDHDLELESGKEGLDGGDHGETADHEGGDPGDEAGVEVLAHDRDEEGDGNDGQDGSDDAEKGHGIVGAVESGDGAQDAQAVGVGVELGLAPLGAVAVVDDDIADGHVLVHGVDAHLCLDLKALGHDGEGLDEIVAEGAVAGHDVPDIVVKENIDAVAHKAVPEVVEGPFVLLKIGGGEAVADDHVDVFVQDKFGHLRGALRGVGVVAVGHDVALCVDVAEHAADDVALALHVFVADDGARFAGDFGRAVGGIVVVDIDDSLGKGSAEIRADLPDRFFFIVAGDENGDFVHGR